jgi:cation:H+ antiporter
MRGFPAPKSAAGNAFDALVRAVRSSGDFRRFRFMGPYTLLQATLLVGAGLALLAIGGEFLVRGAINASRLLRVSPVVVGLTLVAFATSLPELAVSFLAAIRGSPDVAVGNVVGSNLFNIAVIIGLSAVFFAPLPFRSPSIWIDLSVMMLSAAAVVAFGWDGHFGRAAGIVFVVCLVAFLALRVRGARNVEALAPEAEEAMAPHGGKQRGIFVSTVLIFSGAGLLTGGAEALVRGALVIAREAGVSERVIALTLVSAGTGLPELATAIVAGIRRHSAVAVGNVIGSNIFNVFGILGTVALVHPIEASARLIHHDALWMLGISALVLLPSAKAARSMSRLEGAAFLAVYAAYIVWLFR